MAAARPITVMVADEHPIMRDGLRDALDSEDDSRWSGSPRTATRR